MRCIIHGPSMYGWNVVFRGKDEFSLLDLVVEHFY